MKPWMNKNLYVTNFRNGDLIPEVKTEEEWKNFGVSGSPAWCYFNNNPGNGKTYGKLYNWFAVNDNRILAPIGYHIPTDDEWTKLSKGFNMLRGGYRNDAGKFEHIDKSAVYWCFDDQDSYTARTRAKLYGSEHISRDLFYKQYGFSVRCIKDNQ